MWWLYYQYTCNTTHNLWSWHMKHAVTSFCMALLYDWLVFTASLYKICINHTWITHNLNWDRISGIWFSQSSLILINWWARRLMIDKLLAIVGKLEENQGRWFHRMVMERVWLMPCFRGGKQKAKWQHIKVVWLDKGNTRFFFRKDDILYLCV